MLHSLGGASVSQRKIKLTHDLGQHASTCTQLAHYCAALIIYRSQPARGPTGPTLTTAMSDTPGFATRVASKAHLTPRRTAALQRTPTTTSAGRLLRDEVIGAESTDYVDDAHIARRALNIRGGAKAGSNTSSCAVWRSRNGRPRKNARHKRNGTPARTRRTAERTKDSEEVGVSFCFVYRMVKPPAEFAVACTHPKDGAAALSANVAARPRCAVCRAKREALRSAIERVSSHAER